jgi:hypothetical protein
MLLLFRRRITASGILLLFILQERRSGLRGSALSFGFINAREAVFRRERMPASIDRTFINKEF